MMKIENVCKSYSGTKVLDNVSLEFHGGQCIGILGSNGCGKSTLLSVLSGVVKADSGRLLFENEEIACVPQGSVLFKELSVYDNLLLWHDKNYVKESLENGLFQRLGINEYINKPVEKLSGGMIKRVLLACLVKNTSSVLLLDEPSAALDIEGKAFVADYIREFKEAGKSVIITSHEVSEFELFDVIYVLKNGKLYPYEWDGDLKRLALFMKGKV